VTALQNPMDAWSINTIIHDVQPALIIETGTANGGSALMWASALELNRLTDSRVITIDPRHPDTATFGSRK
jgi:cephalosporin hydroxylase